MQRFHQKQDRLAMELAVEPLYRQQDRILRLAWSDTPLFYDHPRFGSFETKLADRPRSGWYVNLAQDLQDAEPHILDWVLWREALLSLLLPHLRHISEAADLGLYAGLRYGDYLEPEALTTLWKQVSPPQHYQHYIYYAPFGFPLFDQVVAGSFLHRALPWLNTLRPTTTPLATPTYTSALERWMLETHIPLTPPEHHILTALSTLTTPLHQSRLANQLNMSISGLSQHLTKLAQRHLLRLNYFINLPLIGLTPYELIIHTPNHNTRKNIVRLFSKIRYTWFINPIQHTRLHCRVFIPTKNAAEFQDWLMELTKQYDLLPIEPLRTDDIIQAWHLNIYIPDYGWPDDITLQLHQVQAIFDDQYDTPLPPLFTSNMSYELLKNSQRFPITLRPEDFTYFLRAADIHQITDRITPQASKELRQAGISETAHMVYRRRIRQLEKMSVSQVQGMFIMHIGLDTILQIYIYESRLITEQVIKALSVFPNIDGLVFSNGNGLLILSIPNQTAVDMISTLRKIFAKNEIDGVIEAKPTWQSWSGFESPVKLQNYNLDKKEWEWERTTLPKISAK